MKYFIYNWKQAWYKFEEDFNNYQKLIIIISLIMLGAFMGIMFFLIIIKL